MKGDFSRDTFEASKHFSRVLMQQGRVQLDADPNEQAAILLHYLHTLARDILGPYVGPMADDERGFAIDPAANYKIGPGRYYVDGILCQNEQRWDVDGHEVFQTYDDQLDYLDPEPLPGTTPFLFYLDVWERLITPIEDDDIREKALGSADTAARAKVVWQVRAKGSILDEGVALPGDEQGWRDLVDANWSSWVETWQPEENRARMSAWTDKPGSGEAGHPCLVSAEAKYRSDENRLYRVEIHDGSKSGKATFKWSRDNGSVVAEWLGTQGDNLIVRGMRDQARGFVPEAWVELLHDGLELRQEIGTMVKLAEVSGEALTVYPKTAVPQDASIGWNETWVHPKVRCWQVAPQEIKPDVELKLGDGIKVQFSAGGVYRTGDYWLIPARAAVEDVEWPQEEDSSGKLVPKAMPPHGVIHHYAPLAIVRDGDGPVDLRRKLKQSWE